MLKTGLYPLLAGLAFFAACALVVLVYILSAELLASLYGMWLSPHDAEGWAYLTPLVLVSAWVMGLAILGWWKNRAFARAR